MRAILKSVAAGMVALAAVPAIGQAQTVERIELYRNAAVITWKSTVSGPEASTVARSFSGQDGPVILMTEPASLALDLPSNETEAWASEADRQGEALVQDRLKELRLERALKQAQLDLVEEDLALLRENRGIGGTAEAVLVEDIEEVSRWMHDAFREALYRRVELREELMEMDEAEALLLQERAPFSTRRTVVHRAASSDGQDGVVWSRTVEYGAGWQPADMLALEGMEAQWSQRIAYHLEVPHSGEAEVVFVDAEWEGETASLQRVESQSYDKRLRAEVVPALAAAPAMRHPVATPIGFSGRTAGEIPMGTFRRDVAFQHRSVPAVIEGVETVLALSEGDARIIDAGTVVLKTSDRGPTVAPISRSADSIRVALGLSSDWSVRRDVEPGLCSRSVLGSRVRHRRSYAIEVANLGAVAGTLSLVEPLPRNRSLEIEVRPEELDGGRLDEDREELQWTLTLQPGERRTVRFGYDISHDRDTPVPDWN